MKIIGINFSLEVRTGLGHPRKEEITVSISKLQPFTKRILPELHLLPRVLWQNPTILFETHRHQADRLELQYLPNNFKFRLIQYLLK